MTTTSMTEMQTRIVQRFVTATDPVALVKVPSDVVSYEASLSDIHAVAKEWLALNPDNKGLAVRLPKAIALTGSILQMPQNRGIFFVEGGGGTYIVRANPTSKISSCTCPDGSARGSKCKHILAVGLVYAAKKKHKPS